MKYLFIFFAFLAFKVQAGEKGAYRLMNGSNRIQREIHWAWYQLPNFLKACYYSEDCHLTAEQKKIVLAVIGNTKQYTPETLVFVSERARPDLFQASNGEAHRLAVTGFSPSEKIFINSDQESKLGKSRGISFWMGILAHEMTHHLGITDNEQRIPDQIGAAIAKAAAEFLVTIPVPEDSGDVIVQILNPPAPSTSQVWQGLPNGAWFQIFESDDQTSIDVEVVDGMYRQICKQKAVVSMRVSPEVVNIIKDPRGEGLFRAQLGFSSETVCVDKAENRAFRQALVAKHVLGLKKTDRYQIDLSQPFDMGLGGPSDQFGKYERGEILSLEAPGTVKAGVVIRVRAQVKFRDGLVFNGCSAFLFSPEWPVTIEGTPGVVVPERCQFKKIAAQTYQIEFEKDVPLTAKPVDLEIQLVCLMVDDSKTPCMPSYPSKKTVIKVINPIPPADISITNFNLGGVKEVSKEPRTIRFVYPEGKSFFVQFTIKNASSLENATLDLGTDDGKGNGGAISVPFNRGPNNLVPNATFTQNGPDLDVKIELKWGQANEEFYIALGQIEGLSVTTKDFHSISIDLRSQNLIVGTVGAQ